MKAWLKSILTMIVTPLALSFVGDVLSPFAPETLPALQRCMAVVTDWTGFPWVFAGSLGLLVGMWVENRLSRIRAPVHKKLKRAFVAAERAGIGKPLGKAEVGGIAVWFEHERAACFWAKQNHRLYQLPSVADRPPLYVQDLGSSGYHDEENNKNLPGLPAEAAPPMGGVAAAWHRDPDRWSWIGPRKWRETIEGRALIVQQFENGFIAGMIPKGAGLPEKRVVWVVDGKIWGFEEGEPK